MPTDTASRVNDDPWDQDLHLDPEADDNDAFAIDDMDIEAAREWRVADALTTLLKQINDLYPSRDIGSDGTIGDAAHRSRRSDHNPHVIDGSFGVVTALDITHDPQNGCDAGRIARGLRDARDPRIKYIIWNRQIANASPIGGAPAWAWRAYTGTNPHNKHCHISVKATKAAYDDTRSWTLPPASMAEGVAVTTEEDDPETLIRNALAALSGSTAKSLLQTLVDAQDTLGVLLSRYNDAQRAPALTEDGVEAPPPDLAQLRADYVELWSTCQIDPTKAGVVAWHHDKLLKGRARYQEVADRTGAPWWFIGIVHALEASFNFTGHLHNGDPLTARTIQVPRGRPERWNPPSDWVSSAVDAITHDGNAGVSNWGVAEALFRFERYNGFGYRSRAINSPYLWSFSNHYKRGKFVADRTFSDAAVSKQCGAAVMLKALVKSGEVKIGD